VCKSAVKMLIKTSMFIIVDILIVYQGTVPHAMSKLWTAYPQKKIYNKQIFIILANKKLFF
jgi:hypothetical protein